jgi:hypothetical protein
LFLFDFCFSQPWFTTTSTRAHHHHHTEKELREIFPPSTSDSSEKDSVNERSNECERDSGRIRLKREGPSEKK